MAHSAVAHVPTNNSAAGPADKRSQQGAANTASLMGSQYIGMANQCCIMYPLPAITFAEVEFHAIRHKLQRERRPMYVRSFPALSD